MQKHWILEQFYALADQNNWHDHHTPKNLACAISVESAELLELFQWQAEESAQSLTEQQKLAVGDELSDVLMYCLVLADKLDIDIEDAIKRKIHLNQAKA